MLHKPMEFVDLAPEEVQQLPAHLGKNSNQVPPNDSKTEKIDFHPDFWLYTLNFGLAILLVGAFVFWLVIKLPKRMARTILIGEIFVARIYAGSSSEGNTVTVIDGVTNGTTTVAVEGGPFGVAVNSATSFSLVCS